MRVRALINSEHEIEGVFELYYVDLSSSFPAGPKKISDTGVAKGGVKSFAFLANGKKIIYLADQDIPDVTELYYVDLASRTPSLPQRIHTQLTGGQRIGSWRLMR